MAFQGRHIEAGSFLGSWPLLPSQVAGTPVLLPRTMKSNATIVGIKREPAAGFDVDARSFILNVDGVDKTIGFSYGGFLPLSVVISQINAAVGATVASNDNGFLRLQSTTSGNNSYLKVKTDGASSPTNVLQNLGLFPEVESYAGDLYPAAHVDPDRQVASPNQMTMAEGENFEARVFNRALAQLSLNNDRNEGLLSKKRVAVRNSWKVTSYSQPGSIHGVQLSGGYQVYAGKVSSPDVDTQLAKLFQVLDGEGRELSKDVYFPIATGNTGTFTTSSDGTSRQLVTSTYFSAAAEATLEPGNYYLLSNAFTGGGTVLNGKPLKIIEIRNAANEAVIENIDPATGQRVTLSNAGISFSIVRRDRLRVMVDGVYENVTTATAGTPRLENLQVTKRSAFVPTRVELGNRIVCVGQNFYSAPALQVGDLVTWASSTINTPFNNNGTYRVDKILDKETIQVVASDWGAAVLNPITTGGSFGTVAISTDGMFVLDPFIRFSSSTSLYSQPANGETVEVAMLAGTTFRAATDNNPAIFQDDVRFTQEADDTLARAIVRLWGPSVTSVDSVLYGDYRNNLESVSAKLNQEHYNYDEAEKTGSTALDTRSWGRHKDIRPDTVDMWYWTPSVTTPRMTLRGTGTRGHSDTNTTGDSVLQLISTLNAQPVLQLDGDGRTFNLPAASSYVGRWQDFQFEAPDSFPNLGGTGLVIGSERVIWKGKHRWYSSNTNLFGGGNNISMYGQQLLFDFEMPNSVTSGRFTTLIGQQIKFDSTGNNGAWAQTLKFLDLGGALQKHVTNNSSNWDSVQDFYGIHLNYTLSSNFKIYNNHYGLKIEDITRSGTAFGGPTFPSVRNYSIYTGLGVVRFGDAVEATRTWSSSADDNTYLGSFSGTWGYAATNPRTMNIDHFLTHTSGTIAQSSAMEVVAQATGTGTTTSLYGVNIQVIAGASQLNTDLYGLAVVSPTISNTPARYRGMSVGNISSAASTYNAGLEIGTVSGSAAGNYGLKIGNVSSTNPFAISTGTGIVGFGDRVQTTVSGSRNNLTSGIGFEWNVTENATAPTGGSIGAWLDYNMANTNNTSFTASAMWIRFRKSTGFFNSGAHSILRLTNGTIGVAQGTHYGLYIDTLSAGSTNYAIWAQNGLVRFNGTMDMNSNLISNLLTPATAFDATHKRYVDGMSAQNIGNGKLVNAIINGCGIYNQRGLASYALTNTPAYTLDRWRAWDTNGTPQSTVQPQLDNTRPVIQIGRNSGSTNVGTDSIILTQEIARSFVCIGLPHAGSSEGMTLSFMTLPGPNFSAAGGLLRVRVLHNTGLSGITGAIGSGLTYGAGGTTTLLDTTINIVSGRKFWTIPVTGINFSTSAMTVIFSYTPTGTAGASDYYQISHVLLIPGDCVTSTTQTSETQGPVNCRYSPAGGSLAMELWWCERFYEKSYRLQDPPGTVTTSRGWSTTTTATSVANGSAWELGAQPQFRVRKANSANTSGSTSTRDSPNVNPTITVYTIGGTSGQFFVGGANRASNAPVAGATEVGFEIYNNTGGAVAPTAGLAYGHWTADYEIV